jgi:hypothetical protein
MDPEIDASEQDKDMLNTITFNTIGVEQVK